MNVSKIVNEKGTNVLACISHDVIKGQFGQYCPESKYQEQEVDQKVRGRDEYRKVLKNLPVLVSALPQFTNIFSVRYQQEVIVTPNYTAPANVEIVVPSDKDRRYHSGRLIRTGINKKTGEAYLTIHDATRIDTETGKNVPRSVRLNTLSYLEINGKVVIQDGFLRLQPKLERKLVMRRAWMIFKANGAWDGDKSFGECLKEAWASEKASIQG